VERGESAVECTERSKTWETATTAREENAHIATKQSKSLKTKKAKLNAVKEQIKIRVIGFDWKDLHQDGTA
jgi:hypothetical protein